MQTLVAYSVTEGSPHRFAGGAARVERHYAALAGGQLRHDAVEVAGRGLHVWEAHDEPRRWPTWQRERDVTVATLHTPFNYERVVGDLPPERAAVPLMRGLLQRPQAVLQLGSPFVVAGLDREELVLLTDAVGLGRLFELRLPGATIWTNRPTAAHLFSGVPVAADLSGWRYLAGSDWFMADSTPFDGLRAIGPATAIRVGSDGHARVSQVDSLQHWIAEPGTGLDPDRLDQVVDALQASARSTARLWTTTPRVDLSGGRDSRLVAAAFLSSGVDVDLHTNANPPGEADVANELLRLWGKEVRHEVTQMASVSAPVAHPIGAADRALGWMRHSEALHPPSYLPRMPPSTHASGAGLLAGGVAGELAHGHYYPPDVAAIEALEPAQQLEACSAYLKRRLVPPRGARVEAQVAVHARVDEVFRQAVAAGASPLIGLDVFYLVERLRRWGTTADRPNLLIPLLTPEFVEAALRLQPQQRRENALHRELVARMIPQWADVPYFAAPPAVPGQARPQGMWELDQQREVLAALLHSSSSWEDCFDVAQVHQLWHKAASGRASAGESAVLQRVIWRSAFAEYADEVNGRASRRPAPMAVTEVGKVPAPARPAPGRARQLLRRVPGARQAARTRIGRRVRRIL